LTCDLLRAGPGWWVDDVRVQTHDEPCDARACGVPGEVRLASVDKQGGEVVLEWGGDPLCLEFVVWRSTDPTEAATLVNVTNEDPDPTDLIFRDAEEAPLLRCCQLATNRISARDSSPL